MTDEEKVRAAWECVGIQWANIGRKRYGMAHSNGLGIPLQVFLTEDEIWSAAAAFTDDRLEQIRQIERNIQWLNESFPDLSHLDWACNVEECDHYSCNLWVPEFVIGQCARNRILASQQAALAELRRGMK